MVDSFLKKLNEEGKEGDLETVTQIKETIKSWKQLHKTERPVDIELIMEAVDKLENADKEILLKFCKDSTIQLAPIDDNHLSRYIRKFIRGACYVSSSRLDYLKPILRFFDEGGNEFSYHCEYHPDTMKGTIKLTGP